MDEARGCVADDHYDGGWDGDLLRGGTAWQVRLFRGEQILGGSGYLLRGEGNFF